MNRIRNIIFDLGGVLMDLYVEKTYQAFGSLGFTEEILEFDRKNKNIFFQYELGKISTRHFRDEIRKLLDNNVRDEQIDFAWNAMVGGFRKDKIELVKSLRPRYKTFILSNTNQMHEDFYNQMILSEFGMRSFEDLVDRIYYSHHLQLAKPDPEIFKYVIKDSRLVPGETLYLDDTKKHLESAATLGIQTILFPLNGDLGIVSGYLKIH